MLKRIICTSFLMLAIALLFQVKADSRWITNDWYVNAAMRNIGHQLLLQMGDTSSRVLPILQEKKSYRIRFEVPLKFKPEILVSIISRTVSETNLADEYLVEVISSDSSKVMHSYYVLNDTAKDKSTIACVQRELPRAKYEVQFTILDKPFPMQVTDGAEESLKPVEKGDSSNVSFLLILIGLSALVILWKVKSVRNNGSMGNIQLDNHETITTVIPLGAYLFDTRNMQLTFQEEKTELTSKESDLLEILCSNANTTVEKEVLLKNVWGDEGGYVGRTLDVFVSKLRKKLEADLSVKIVNVRGVGYKLILNK